MFLKYRNICSGRHSRSVCLPGKHWKLKEKKKIVLLKVLVSVQLQMELQSRLTRGSIPLFYSHFLDNQTERECCLWDISEPMGIFTVMYYSASVASLHLMFSGALLSIVTSLFLLFLLGIC